MIEELKARDKVMYILQDMYELERELKCVSAYELQELELTEKLNNRKKDLDNAIEGYRRARNESN